MTKIKLHKNSRTWDYIVSEEPVGRIFQANEFGALIYNKSAGIEVLQTSQLTKSSNSFTRNPFLVNMKVSHSRIPFQLSSLSQMETNHILIAIFHVKATNFVDKTPSNQKAIDEINNISVLAMALRETIKRKFFR